MSENESDALMLLVWERWAEKEGNEGAAKLFRRVHDRLNALQADKEQLDWWESQRTNALAPVMDAQGWRLHEADHLRPLAVPFCRTLRDAIAAARSPLPTPPEPT